MIAFSAVRLEVSESLRGDDWFFTSRDANGQLHIVGSKLGGGVSGVLQVSPKLLREIMEQVGSAPIR